MRKKRIARFRCKILDLKNYLVQLRKKIQSEKTILKTCFSQGNIKESIFHCIFEFYQYFKGQSKIDGKFCSFSNEVMDFLNLNVSELRNYNE